MPDPSAENLLEVQGLKMHFPISEGFFFNKNVSLVKAVDGINFSIKRGETLGLVGESGCGKTTTGRSCRKKECETKELALGRGSQQRQQALLGAAAGALAAAAAAGWRY